jgi:hypothetical protein
MPQHIRMSFFGSRGGQAYVGHFEFFPINGNSYLHEIKTLYFLEVYYTVVIFNFLQSSKTVTL